MLLKTKEGEKEVERKEIHTRCENEEKKINSGWWGR
jgi:hypothetical protein